MANCIEPCYSEKIMTANGGFVTNGTEKPNSTINCLINQEPHVVVGINIRDLHGRHLLQRKSIKPLEDQMMLSVASIGHVEHCDDLVGEPLDNFLTLDYLKEAIIAQTRQELGDRLLHYFRLESSKLKAPDIRYDQELDEHSMNHITALFNWTVSTLHDNIIQLLFTPTEEVDAIRVLDREELNKLTKDSKERDERVIVYPPIKQLIKQWLL